MRLKNTTPLGEILLQRDLITPDQLEQCLPLVEEWGSPLGQVLVAQGYLRSVDLYEALAEHHELDFVDLIADPGQRKLLDVRRQSDYVRLDAIPWKKDRKGRVVIATTDPSPELRAWARSRGAASV